MHEFQRVNRFMMYKCAQTYTSKQSFVKGMTKADEHDVQIIYFMLLFEEDPKREKQNHRVPNKYRRYFLYWKNYKAITEDEHFFNRNNRRKKKKTNFAQITKKKMTQMT